MEDAVLHFEQKLKYETDPWDVFESLKKGEKIVVIDTRSKESFDNEHIKGAINIHHRILTAETTKHLDKSFQIVTYCTGVGCNASTKGALKLAQLGFKVKELIGGLEWWKRDAYPTEGLKVKEKVAVV